MATAKILAQNSTAAATEEVLYTVPASTTNRVYSIVVCNRSGVSDTYRIAFTSGGATSVDSYMYYDVALAANTTTKIAMPEDIMLPTGYKVYVYSAAGSISFTLLGL